MSENQAWQVESKDCSRTLGCREDQIGRMVAQAGIPRNAIPGYHAATREEWQHHLRSGRAKRVAVRGRAVWMDGDSEAAV